MIKLILGFAAMAAMFIYVLVKSGADVDMGGEKHSVDVPVDGRGAASVAAPPAARAASR